MNTVTCNVCGQQVTKRQSCAVNGGRACKIHESVAAEHEKLQAAEAKRIKKEQEKAKPKHHSHRPLIDPVVLTPHCWICRTQGITLREFYLRQLVGMEKIDIKTNLTGEKLNFFEMLDRAFKESGVEKKTILFQFDELSPGDRKRVSLYCNRDTQILIDMAGAVICCQHCMKKVGLVYTPPEMNPTHDQLMNCSVNYQVFMKPAMQEIAQQEIEQEAIKN